MVSKQALLLLVFCVSVHSQSTNQYAMVADLDYCGQSCPSSCEEVEDEDAMCRCDSECERYGDCCSPPSGRLNCTGGEQRTQPLAGLQCRSIHLDSRTQADRLEAFWMVSACPGNWPANQDDDVQGEVDEKCSNGSDTLPPVTDLDGGVVYKNEYCAVCHQVANIQPWGYRFGCSPCLKNKLANQNVNLTREMIEKECMACGFHVPQTGPPPRPCLHDSLVVGECLIREVLEERTGSRWEEEVYGDTVLQCQTGPVRPVAANACNHPPFYRNQYCAICNAEKTADLRCGEPYNYKYREDYCLVEAQFCDPFEDDSSESTTTPKPNTPEDPTSFPEGSRQRKAAPSDPGPETSGSTKGNTTKEYFSCNLGPTDYASFTLFFDVTGDSGVITSDVVSSNITTFCSINEVFDPVNQACRKTVCPVGLASVIGSCAITLNIPQDGIFNSTNDPSMICDGALIVLQESEFELVDNDTLLFRNVTYDILGYIDDVPIVCSNFKQNGTFIEQVTVVNYSYPPIFSILTYVGCLLSTAGCVSVLLTYSLFKELRTLPGQILMNLVSTILATSLFILIGIPVAVLVENDKLCEATAIFLHWLMLSQFSWMSIMSFEQVHTFYRASRLYPVEDVSSKNKIFPLYLLIGWGTPFVITLVTVIVNYSSDVIQYGRDGFCWVSHLPSFYAVFVAPVALSIVVNNTTLIVTLIMFFKASRKQAKLKNRKRTSYFRISLCVFSITGLTWIFGFLAILIGDDWAWYAFIILTSTQGLGICTAFIFTQKIGGLYKQLFFKQSNCNRNELEGKHLRKNRTMSTNATYTQTQHNTKATEETKEKMREEMGGDHVSIEVENTQKAGVGVQTNANESDQ